MCDDDTDPDAVSEPVTAAGGVPDLSLDTVFELLAARRRRIVLYSLVDASDVTTIGTLTGAVATAESVIAHEALTRDHYLEVATDLYHWHLPVLADVGVIEWDERSETIRYWGHSTLETWIRRARRLELG